MSRRAYAKTSSLLALGATLALPATGLAGTSGGASATPSDPPAPSSERVTLRATRATMLRSVVTFRGNVPDSRPGHTVLIERNDGRRGWTRIAQATSGRGGAFSARWRTDRTGNVQLRARQARGTRSASSASSAPRVQVAVHRPARATYYGPGFYGHRTACGVRLTTKTIGVAHRTLPCGTKVSIYYRGRTIVAPVIDRGPYANHADWDLTSATASRVHMSGTSTIGYLTLRR